METIRLLLIDDHKIVRDGIKSILQGEGEIEIVGEAESASEALQVLSDILVDIALVDINMPGMNGIDLTKEISRSFKNVRVCGLSMVSEKEHINEMIQNGAKGYLLKTTGKEDLVKALFSISRDEPYFSPEIKSLLSDTPKETLSPKAIHEANHSFSEKEILILTELAGTGNLTPENLSLNQKTLEIYLKNLQRKTNTPDLPALIRFAREKNLMPMI